MFAPKALLVYNGETFMSRVCAAAKSASAEIIVIAGKHHHEITATLPPGVKSAVNPAPEGGMISSVRVGLGAVNQSASGVIISLVDQPFVGAEIYAAMAAAHAETPDRVIIPRFRGRKRGHPIVLPKSALPLCFEGPDNLGLHWVTHHPSVFVRDIDFETDCIIRDVDTPQDYQNITQEKSV